MATLITPGGGDPSGKPNNPGSGVGASGVAPQLHIDSDWKAQAQAEKERLAKAEEERAAKAAGQPGGTPASAGAGGQGGEFAPPDFRALVDMLAMQAIMYMGGMADRTSGRAVFDPEYSRHMIDLLGVLEEKTKGNLAADEAQDLKVVLHELRLRYVELMKLVAQQAASKGVASATLAGSAGAGSAGLVGAAASRGAVGGSAGASPVPGISANV